MHASRAPTVELLPPLERTSNRDSKEVGQSSRSVGLNVMEELLEDHDVFNTTSAYAAMAGISASRQSLN